MIPSVKTYEQVIDLQAHTCIKPGTVKNIDEKRGGQYTKWPEPDLLFNGEIKVNKAADYAQELDIVSG
jgi:hypothetical protein